MTCLIKGRTGLWEIVIGLEVHAQVISKAKLFSSASTAFGADPNTQVSFVDAGMPGMLPVINGFCVDQAIKTGLGLNGTINLVSIFDRKNYFYPDLPNGYQISQFYHPIVTKGYLEIDAEDCSTKCIGITRLHLEQDAGKSIHDLHPTKSYIDLNRAGIALMEIVSEPDIRSVYQAQQYVKKLRSILRYLETCGGNMEQGSLRVDANVSLRRPGEPFGTRAEIKNVNSIRFLGQAIDYEIRRQIDILENGGNISQETRLFDQSKGETRPMRSKEDAHDYRYFPDPDLLPLRLTQERIEKIRLSMPELPDAKIRRFVKEFNITPYEASILVAEKESAHYYESAVASSKSDLAAKMIANWMMGELFAFMNKENLTIDKISFKPSYLADLVDLILDGTLSGKMAKEVFAQAWQSSQSPKELVQALNLKQIIDTSVIEQVIQDILAKEASKIAEYKSGKDKLFGYFVGQVMKTLQGKANPTVVNNKLKKYLSS